MSETPREHDDFCSCSDADWCECYYRSPPPAPSPATTPAEPTCQHCGGEMIQMEDGPDDTLECAWCDGPASDAPAPPRVGFCNGHFGQHPLAIDCRSWAPSPSPAASPAQEAVSWIDRALGDTDPSDPDHPLLLASQALSRASQRGAP